MKSTKIIRYFSIAALCATTMLSSCADWLEEDPKTFISPSSFYQTEEDFEGALRGLYPQGQNLNLTQV